MCLTLPTYVNQSTTTTTKRIVPQFRRLVTWLINRSGRSVSLASQQGRD